MTNKSAKREPALIPTISLTQDSMFASISAFRTPTCATQRIPPPQKAKRRGGILEIFLFLLLSEHVFSWEGHNTGATFGAERFI